MSLAARRLRREEGRQAAVPRRVAAAAGRTAGLEAAESPRLPAAAVAALRVWLPAVDTAYAQAGHRVCHTEGGREDARAENRAGGGSRTQGACAHGHTTRTERGQQASTHASMHARRAGTHTRKRSVSKRAGRHHTRAANGTPTSPQLHSTAVCSHTHLRARNATVPVPTLPVSHPSSLLPVRTSRFLPESGAWRDVVEFFFFFREGRVLLREVPWSPTGGPGGAASRWCARHSRCTLWRACGCALVLRVDLLSSERSASVRADAGECAC